MTAKHTGAVGIESRRRSHADAAREAWPFRTRPTYHRTVFIRLDQNDLTQTVTLTTDGSNRPGSFPNRGASMRSLTVTEKETWKDRIAARSIRRLSDRCPAQLLTGGGRVARGAASWASPDETNWTPWGTKKKLET